MADLITIGSLYLDGHPYPIGERYRNFQPISIGNSVSGQEISWVVANGLLIADRSLLTCISWEDLFENHLIFGQKITVDGYSFQLSQEEDIYCFSSCITSKFLAESKSRRIRQKLKMIWSIIRGKDYINHDVILNRAELKQLAEIFVAMSNREVKNEKSI